MEILEINAFEYDKTFQYSYHIFNSARFNELNSSKCEKVHYLVFKDSKIRLGIILGVKQNRLFSPFSSPFGGFETITNNLRLSQIDEALLMLDSWVKQNNYSEISITLPPVFYNNSFISKLCNCLYRFGYQNVVLDLNYHFPVSKLQNDYLKEVVWYNSRKNLKISFKVGLVFEKIDENKGLLAYEIIKKNRGERGFPLRMTWEQILTTMEVVKMDFFIVKRENEGIAAAILYHVSPKVVQVVYWGDLPSHSECKTMNFLSYSVFNYYNNTDIEIIDIGPSTENSIPNFGLCEFKESIGCDISNKYKFTKIIKKCL